MYTRTKPAEFLLAACLLLFAGFWTIALHPSDRTILPRGFAPGADALPDDAIQKKLVGIWVVPRADATGPDDIELRTLRQFNADGSGIMFVYGDADCAQMINAMSFDWSVKDGNLVSHFQGSAPARNEIISVGGKTFVFADRNNVAHRRDRRDSCGRS